VQFVRTSTADRVADLSVLSPQKVDVIVVVSEERRVAMIDGLKVTLTGEELRARLDERVKDHEREAEWYKRRAKSQSPEDDRDDDNDDVVLPEHMCDFERELHEWRAEVLAYLRDHLDASEVYRLGEADLEFGELLPEKPGCVEQEEFERETGPQFAIERLAREVRKLTFGDYAVASRGRGTDEPN
jgi:hypothetical protein